MVRDAVERWCRQSSHYEWLSGYLATRGMRGATRVLMAFTAASAAAWRYSAPPTDRPEPCPSR